MVFIQYRDRTHYRLKNISFTSNIERPVRLLAFGTNYLCLFNIGTHGNKLQVASKVTVLVRTKKLCSPTSYKQRICKSKSCPISSKIKKNPDYQKVCFPKLFRFNKVSGFCIPLLLGGVIPKTFQISCGRSVSRSTFHQLPPPPPFITSKST